MEMTERHRKAILNMFVNSFASASPDKRKAIYDDFLDSFYNCFNDLDAAIKDVFSQKDISMDVISEWNTYQNSRKALEFSIEICDMELKDEDVINRILAKEIGCIPHLAKYEKDCTIREFATTGYSFVAKIKGEIIGVMMAQKIMDYGHPIIFINNFAVASDFQGKGIGKKMMLHLVQLSEKEGLCKIMLGTEKNRKAYDIYHKWGFSDQDENYVYLSNYHIGIPHK